jgi:hypothetical protein
MKTKDLIWNRFIYKSEKMQSNFQRFGKLGWFDSFGLAEIQQFLFSAYNQLEL